jgi:hypothetical protein
VLILVGFIAFSSEGSNAQEESEGQNRLSSGHLGDDGSFAENEVYSRSDARSIDY